MTINVVGSMQYKGFMQCLMQCSLITEATVTSLCRYHMYSTDITCDIEDYRMNLTNFSSC